MKHVSARRQAGQSLIETIVAIFILTTALSGSIGLAVYAFSNSTISQNEIIATNLAREGVDVVRGMRDSNWLAGQLASDASYNLTSCSDLGGKLCYPKAYSGPTYNLPPGNLRVNFNTVTNTWVTDNNPAHDLYFYPSEGVYGWTPNSSVPVFARMVNISFNPPDNLTASVPANAYTFQNPEMIIKSVVAWRGKGCAQFASADDLLTFATSCKIIVEEHLTNWKDYE